MGTNKTKQTNETKMKRIKKCNVNSPSARREIAQLHVQNALAALTTKRTSAVDGRRATPPHLYVYE